MLARRTPAILAALALSALLPAAASANTVKVKAPEPGEGKAGLVQFDVLGKKGKPIGDVKVSVGIKRAFRKELGVVVETYKRAKAMTVIAYVFNPKDGAARAASDHMDFVIKLKSGRKLQIEDVQRIRDVYAEITDEQQEFICKKKKKGKKLIKELLGTFQDGGTAPNQIVNALRRVLCGKSTAEDAALFEELGLTVGEDPEGGGDETDCTATPTAPGCGTGDQCTADPTAPGCGSSDPCTADPTAPGCGGGGGGTECTPGSAACPLGSFSCSEFPGDTFEGSCGFGFSPPPPRASAAFTGTSFNALKIEASGGNAFSNCFHETATCSVQNPAGANSFITWTYSSSQSSSGELNLRSSNQMYANWSELTIYGSTDGGTTFERLNSFDPQ